VLVLSVSENKGDHFDIAIRVSLSAASVSVDSCSCENTKSLLFFQSST
jgi:hypothetical protein